MYSILAFSFESMFRSSLMSEKSCVSFSPISFETNPDLLVFMSTYLVLVRFLGAIRIYVILCHIYLFV